MVKRGFHNFLAYVLYNYKDTPEDFYYRLRETVKLQLETSVNVASFIMRYQPIMEVDNRRKYVGIKWTSRKRTNVLAIQHFHSASAGTISATTMQEFEYWFGKDADEFDKLLSYPKLRRFLERKKGALRMARAKGIKM